MLILSEMYQFVQEVVQSRSGYEHKVWEDLKGETVRTKLDTGGKKECAILVFSPQIHY